MSIVEHAIKTVVIDHDFAKNLDALSAEGWEALPGVAPIAIYHVVRRILSDEEKAAAASALGNNAGKLASMGVNMQIAIDDSKVHVVGPDGKVKG